MDLFQEQEEDLIDLVHEKEVLEQKVIDLEATIREWAQKFIDISDKQKLMQTNHENIVNNLKRQYKCNIFYIKSKYIFYLITFFFKDSILTYCINQVQNGIDRTEDTDLYRSKKSIKDLLSKLQNATTGAKIMQDVWQQQKNSNES